MLVESLQLLAAPATDQISALPDFVCVTDEIVSTFGDAYPLVPQLTRAGLVTENAASALKRVDDYLAELPQDGTLTDPATLASEQFWTNARDLANQALVPLGEGRATPHLKHVTYVK